MQKLKIFLIFSVLLSCGGKKGSERELTFTKLKPEVFKSLVNDHSFIQRSNQTLEKTIYSDKAKAYFSIYDDGKIYYDIPGVGTGEGTWKDKGTYLELIADTGLFDMILEIRTKDNENFEFHYRDRFGFNIVPAKVKNVD